ncbi:MAG: cell division protein FtsZ [Candidatus Nealsonbacteria bacterium]|nr:cell division protein FtsZ [Candidatus Nealsonbacteria bacterium]
MSKKKPKAKKSKKPMKKRRVKLVRTVKNSKAKPMELAHKTRIRIIGIGGGGGSIVSEIAPHVKRADFIVANTDSQALKELIKGVKTFQFGQKFTHGLGCGMDPKLGQKAAREEKDKIAKLFQNIDLCIIVASLGGGTGSGAAPEFARIAKDTGAIVFGIFTTPFKFEGGKRSYIAKNSLEKLAPNLNAVSIIPNENIFRIIDKKTPIKAAFSAINKRLSENLRGLIEMIYLPGLINIDFADVKAILEGRGKLAYLNAAYAQGANRVEEVLKDVLHSPLNEYSIKGAEKILFNISASQELGMKEVENISQTISDFNRRAKIIFGVSNDNNYKDKIRIALLAVGCGKEEKPRPRPKPKPEPKPEPEPKPKPKPKQKRKRKPRPKPRPRPKPKTKVKKKRKAVKENPVQAPVPVQEEQPRILTRRNALDLRKEAQRAEEEMVEKEKKWDIPAFLRRKTGENE